MKTYLTVTDTDIILFDGICVLCSAWVFFVIRRDPKARFKFASVQSAAGQTLLQRLGLPTDHYDTMVYIQAGHVYMRSSAFLRIVQQFGWGWRLFAAFAFRCPRPVRDYCYDRIARNRYRLFGKRQQCLLPSAAIQARFL